MPRRRRRRAKGPAKVTVESLPPPPKGRKQGLKIGRGRLILFAIVAVGLLPVEWIIFNRIQTAPPGDDTAIREELVLDEAWEMHDPYATIPPTSGARTREGATWGVHTEPIANEVQVANLAEGGLIVQYSCDRQAEGCGEIVEQLEAIVGRYAGRNVVLAPGPAVANARIAVTAWGKILKMNSVDEEDFVAFVEAYLDNREE